MSELGISFAFGGAFSSSNSSLDRVLRLYDRACLDALNHLKEVSPDEDGFGWLSLPATELSPIKEMGDWLRGYDSIIQVGIGGSSLGCLMLNQAILGDIYSEKKQYPKFYVADNPDPVKMSAIWNEVRDGTVALIGVSKSGNTIETMSQFLWFREKMKDISAAVDKNILVITDSKNGALRAFSKESKCKALDLPQTVGGRYSVFTAAGLLGAYTVGVNIDNLLLGAQKMSDFLLLSDKDNNPACTLAKLKCAHEKLGKSISVMMPYSSKMSFFTEWFAQLWGESLGKNGEGSTPLRSIGAIDQHSQLQLYVDGPNDKFFTIITIRKHESKIYIPQTEIRAFSSFSYLYTREVGDMLRLEACSTISALVKTGHPVVWIELEYLTEYTLGALIFFYEFLTALTGKIKGINPFDQPSVEQGKRYTRGLMGCTEFAKDAQEVEECVKKLTTKIIRC